MINLSTPNLAGNEWKYVKDCLDTNWISSVGSYVNRFEEQIAEYTGAKYAVATMNGTAALHLALQLAGVMQDDLVIVPNITFIATLNALKYHKANPILIDVNPHTWQMDLDLLEDFLANECETPTGGGGWLYHKRAGKRVVAIMPVHVLGGIGDMQRLMALAQRFGLEVVEDSTEALGSFQAGKHAGTWGKLGCFSFNGNKIISTGGGGMIVTDDAVLAQKAKHLTTQAKSDSFEYIHDEIGYNYRLVNILAAVGVAQMEQFLTFLDRKKEIYQFYKIHLEGLADIRLQQNLPATQSNHWLPTILTEKARDLMPYLTARGIQVRPFWKPMNQLEMFKNDIFVSKYNQSDYVYSQSMSLPCSTHITEAELEQVGKAIKNFYQ